MEQTKVYFSFFAVMIWFAASGLQSPAMADELHWAGCGITKKAFMLELARAYTKKTGIKVDIQGGGATRGIRDAASGKIDIGGACRVAIAGSKLEANAYQIPVAWDALVVVVNKNNPVTDISFQQLQGLYLGKIKNWKTLGGADAPIDLYVRRGKLSGVGRTLRELVFANFEQVFSATHVVKSSGPLEKGIMKNPNGIGVTGISSAKRRDVKILKLDGKYPDYENIRKGEYVLYRPLYLVIAKDNHDKKVHDFIKYALSREGQAVIRAQGTVPYSEAMSLVMKQLEQYQRASQRGLYQ